MSDTRRVDAYAKINAYLAVTGRRADGYHTLLTHMQAVTLKDSLTLTWNPCPWQEGRVHLTCDDPTLPTDESNLVCRAARALFSALSSKGIETGGEWEICLEKRIPMAAGLGGGSADAAATLCAMNDLLGSPLCLQELCEIGTSLGADIPFCIHSVSGAARAMTAQGIGEVLTPAAGLPEHWHLVIACHGEGVSTPWAYRRLDEQTSEQKREAPRDYAAFLEALEGPDEASIGTTSYNCFEEAVLPERPQADALMQRMGAAGARLVRMSGSGPSVVGCFADESRARACCDALRQEHIVAHICRPLTAEKH